MPLLPPIPIADIAGLRQELDALAEGAGTPTAPLTITDITGLQPALDSKADTSALAPLATSADVAAALALKADTADVDSALEGKAASDDPRLSDPRTPTAHADSHASGGADPLTLSNLTGELAQARVTGLVGALAAKVASDDPRLSDARPPTAHNQAISTITGLQAALAAKADLGADGKVLAAQLSPSVRRRCRI